jgi:hypothetical protein
MAYYHDLITQKSWQILQELKKKHDFVLIGGWAVWLYAQTLKSKDIDIIIDFNQLEKFKKNYDLGKNDRLKKYEFKVEEIGIDVYVPYYSKLGIPVEEIKNYTQPLGGFIVPKMETLLILKQIANQARRLSAKGRKDQLDIFSLIRLPDFEWGSYLKLIKTYQLDSLLEYFKDTINQTTEIKELEINKHQYSRLKKLLLEQLDIK